MTEKLYYYDAYMKEFSARVLSSEKEGELFATILDKTAFFPEEGGQYCDGGTIDGKRVLKVVEKDGVIIHFTELGFEVGATVFGSIDFSERYEKMQIHTAEHILSGLIHSTFGLNNVGFHLGAEEVTMDISAPLSWEQLMEIEEMANKAIFSDTVVEQIFPKKEEISEMQYRSKLVITENLRIIKIGDYDSCACCAPHVKSTGEIGSVKILDFAKLRGGIRIFITAGARALRYYNNMLEQLSIISRLTSTPRLEVADSVKKILADNEELMGELKSIRKSNAIKDAESIAPTDGNLVYVTEFADYDLMRAIANASIGKIKGMLVILAREGSAWKYVIASEGVKLKSEIKKINAALDGKGGGSDVMTQGNFSCELALIEKYFIHQQ